MNLINIVLIGMPTSGKSTVGAAIADRLNIGFIDTDCLIMKQRSLNLSEIISLYGIDAFLDIKSTLCYSLNCHDSIIATGGSVIYSERAMNHLRKNSIILYLKISEELFCSRISDAEERGVAIKTGQSLHELYMERKPIYEKYADYIIDEDGKSLEDTITSVLKIGDSRKERT